MAADPRSEGAGRISVLLIETDARVRRGLRSVIESIPDLEVAGEASSVTTALELFAQVAPKVVVVDLELSTAGQDLELVRHLSRNGCSVVATSMRRTLAPLAMQAGAVSFVEKDERGASSLIAAVRTAANNEHPPSEAQE